MSEAEVFQELMNGKVRPWLNDRMVTGNLRSADGTRLRCYYAINPDASAAITFVHGFCEFFGKYHEVLYRFYEAGYSVFFMELRGHGKSQRYIEPEDLVYVRSYNEYISDLYTFTRQIVFPMTRHLKHVLFGHSMGGAVTAMYLEKHPDDYDIAVMSSPMLGLDFGRKPRPAIRAAAAVSHVARQDFNILPGHTLFDGIPDFENSNAMSEARYDYQFRLRCDDRSSQTWAGTNGWLRASLSAIGYIQRNAKRITIPVCILEAGNDTTVDNSGTDAFAQKVASGTLCVFPGAKHELYNADEENRERWYALILRYLKGKLQYGHDGYQTGSGHTA